MQSKKKQSKRARTVYRAIKSPAVAETPRVEQKAADTAQNSPPPSVEQSQAGDAASAAVRAAAINQLNQYAAYIEQFLQESRMRTIVNRLQAEVAPPTMEEQTYLRLRRD